MEARGPQVPHFDPFRSTDSRFQDIAHFMIFPLTPMLIFFQSATKCLKLGQLPSKVTVHIPSW